MDIPAPGDTAVDDEDVWVDDDPDELDDEVGDETEVKTKVKKPKAEKKPKKSTKKADKKAKEALKAEKKEGKKHELDPNLMLLICCVLGFALGCLYGFWARAHQDTAFVLERGLMGMLLVIFGFASYKVMKPVVKAASKVGDDIEG